ncbi:MAG TPA: amidohydrolase, partial [Pseudonocardiaceae bacterium]|nr:amidohydrolase [Pseudonocardiaceae bacterium]
GMTLRQPSPLDIADGRGPAWLDEWLSTHGSELVAWRRQIHAHPELAFAEHVTTALIAEHLAHAGLRPTVLPRGTGVICDIGAGTPCVALRADIDALPISEATGLPFASTVDGVMHACGHDAHTAILIGTALALASAPALPGRIRVIFQPAEEEMPGGAMEVLAAGGLSGVERIFALHCAPRLRVGEVGTRVGPVTSAMDLLEVRLSSPGGHTARPHLTADLVHALGTVITGLPSLLSRRVDPRSGTVLVWGAAQAGQTNNVVPREGSLRGTLRTADREVWAELETLVRELVSALLAPTLVDFDLRHIRGAPPVINESSSTETLREAIVTALGGDALTGTDQSSGSEDFAWYLEHVPGSICRLGVWSGEGAQHDLHQATFDLDERALPLGVRLMAHTALIALS